MAEKNTESTEKPQPDTALFRHNDLSHPVMQVLLNLELKQPQENE